MSFDKKLRIMKIIDETTDVKTFRLEKKSTVHFVPGQYVLVNLPFEDVEYESRPFTFACSPSKDYIEITVKKFGKITTVMHERLKVGDVLRIRGPRGEALNFDESVRDDIVLIAGGSGITPFKSILEYVVERKLSNEVFLFFSNRTRGDIVYREYLEQISTDNIKVINTLTSEKPDDWKGELGYISKNMIRNHVENPKGYIYYIVGPPPMMEAMKKALIELGVPESKFRIENWQLPGKHDKQS